MDQKTMVHLHNGIPCSREKEGAYTLCNSMDGTGEHYAKWNKPDGEGQIFYNFSTEYKADIFIYILILIFIFSKELFPCLYRTNWNNVFLNKQNSHWNIKKI